MGCTSSWRFGDVQHSLSLSCDFILRLPLWGLSALRGSFSLRSLAGAIMEQVRLSLGAAGMRAVQWVRFDDFSQPADADDEQTEAKLLFFRRCFALHMHYSASSVSGLNGKWNWKRLQFESPLCSG